MVSHDTRVTASATPVTELPLDRLRQLDPGLLSLDEAEETIRGRVPLPLDLQLPAVARC